MHTRRREEKIKRGEQGDENAAQRKRESERREWEDGDKEKPQR